MSSQPRFTYCGGELELFAEARNWKRYWASFLKPYTRGSVLEVGAGLGGSIPALFNEGVESWLCLEPDARLVAGIDGAVSAGALPAACKTFTGTTAELAGQSSRFDCVLYIDVLEHIEQDRAELALAAKLLKPGGALCVLSPAHQWLYSPFDKALGHVRRYEAEALRALTPGGLELVECRYLDSAGMAASLGNRLLLRAEAPSAAQIKFWDRAIVRVSRLLDPLLRYRVGKSVLCVWRRSTA